MLDRESRILEALEAHGSVDVRALADQLQVSAVTIRKDLETLESRLLLRRTRGGAVPRRAASGEGSFNDRLRASAVAKRAIAQEAASLVADGDVIAFDTSTTAYCVAQELVSRQGLVVITQSLVTATMLMEHSSATVVMPGGVLRRESSGLVGTMPQVLAGRGRISKGFFGVSALSTELGLLELGLDESASKTALVEACDAVYGVFTADKASGFGLHSFAAPAEVTGLITDDAATDAFADAWRAQGATVTRVPVASTASPAGAHSAERARRRASGTTPSPKEKS